MYIMLSEATERRMLRVQKRSSNAIQDGAERKSIWDPVLLIPTLPSGRAGTIELWESAGRRGRGWETEQKNKIKILRGAMINHQK